MKPPKSLLLCWVTCISVGIAIAQHFPSRQYMTADGMPSNNVFDVAQQPSGLMWFITKAGPTYYDTKDWHTFPDSLELPTAFNAKIHITGDTIWVAGMSKRSFSIQFYTSDQWQNISTPPEPNLLSGHISLHITWTDDHHTILLASKSNLHQYDLKEAKWITQSIPETDLYTIKEVNNQLMLGTSTGLVMWDKGQFNTIPLPYEQLPNRQILNFFRNDQKLHVLGYNWYAEIEEDSINYLLDDIGLSTASLNTQSSLVQTQDGMIVYSAGTPARILNKESNSWRNLLIDGKSFNIGSTCIFRDIENTIWVSDSRGLFKYNLLQFLNYNQSSGLFNNEVTAITKLSDGATLLANPDGLNKIQNEVISQFEMETGDFSNFRVLDVDEYEGRIYISTNDGGLLIYDKANLQSPIQTFYGEGSRITSTAIFKDQLYISGNGGFYRRSDNTFQKVSNYRGARNLVVLQDRLYLLTTSDGIYEFDGNQFTHFTSDNIDLRSVYQAVYFKGELLLATRDGVGVVSNESIEPWNKVRIKSPVYALMVDQTNRLWIGSDHGVYAYDQERIRLFDHTEGLSGSEINRNALFEDEKGQIWIGTEKGVSVFRNRFNIARNFNLRVAITSALTAEKLTLATYKDQQIPFNQNTVTIGFQCLSYVDEEKTNFRYRINPDQPWIMLASSTNNIILSNLKSGDYNFQIQARFEEGDWGATTSIIFSIDQPFYFKWWFVLLAVIVLLIIIRLIFYYRFIMLIKKQKKLKQEVADFTREISLLNENLEVKVRERTQELNEKNERLEEYAYINAHHLRAPLTKIMSALEVSQMSKEKITDEEMIKILKESVEELDAVIYSINDILKE